MNVAYPKNNNLKYSRYKWLGDIPQDWKTLPIRAILEERKEKNRDGNTNNILSVMKDVGVIRYEDKGNVGNKSSDRPKNYKIVHKNDIVINSMNLVIGSVGIATESGVTSSVYIIYYIKDKANDIRYFYNLFRDKSFQKHLGTYGKGIMELRESIKIQDIKGQRIPIPSTEIQKKIADFLDIKTEKIDQIIEKKQRLIKLLGEYRSVIITKVVTRGHKPNIPMKDSGFDCLGEIPKHWSIKKLQYLGRFQNGISESAEYFGSGYPFISYGDVYKNMVLSTKVEGLAQSSKEERKKMSAEEGDVFFTRTSETIEEIGISSVCMQSIKDSVFSGFIIRFRPSAQSLTKEFSKYYFRSFITRKFFIKEMNIVTRASLAQDLLKRLPVLLPSDLEQKEISDYLDHKTQKIDKSIKKLKEQINKLKEYKKSLIHNSVTGKIKI